MTFDDWWGAYPTQEDYEDNSRNAWNASAASRDAEIAELRQQLADRDEQISDLTISSDTYFAERNSARDVWRRASKDRDELRQQLAALTMQCEKLVKWKHLMSYNDSFFGEHAGDLKRVVYEIDRSMPIRGDK